MLSNLCYTNVQPLYTTHQCEHPTCPSPPLAQIGSTAPPPSPAHQIPTHCLPPTPTLICGCLHYLFWRKATAQWHQLDKKVNPFKPVSPRQITQAATSKQVGEMGEPQWAGGGRGLPLAVLQAPAGLMCDSSKLELAPTPSNICVMCNV